MYDKFMQKDDEPGTVSVNTIPSTMKFFVANFYYQKYFFVESLFIHVTTIIHESLFSNWL